MLARLLFATLLVCRCAAAFPLDTSQPAVQAFADRLEKEGFSREESLAWLAQIDVKPAILNVMDRPSTSRAWFEFAPNFINAKRIGQGTRFWQEQSALLQRAEVTFGVPPAIIVGILGVETHYGRETGRWRALDALGTLAFHYPRRADYFQDELLALFQLTREEGMRPNEPLSSYAGALGWPQFMPSNMRTLAVDFDADGHRNVWSDEADVIGSVAHYLREKGWQPGQPVAVRAQVDADAATIDRILADRFNLNHTVAELDGLGIRAQTPLPDPEARVLLFRLETRNGPEYWLGLQNFYTITRYNKSVNYAMVVWQLGEAVKARVDAAVPASAP